MHRRLLLLMALAIIATAGVVALIGQAAHFGSLASRLRRAELGWLAVCAAGQVISYAGYVLCYQAIARLSGGPRIPMPVVLRVIFLAFGAFSVATTLGGLSVDFWVLRQAGESAEHASARVIALETLRWALLALATCVASVLVLAGLAHRPPWEVAAGWLVVTPACFLAARWISAPERRERFMRGAGLLRRGLAVAVRALVYLRELTGAPAGLRARAVVGAAGFWAGEILCAWAALQAFDAHVAFVPLLVGYSTGLLSEMIPLPAGGAGGVDAALTGGFTLAGVPLSSALLAAVTFRVFTFWLPAVLALRSVFQVGSLRRRLQEIAAERAGA
ncbi:MAG TPA: lysylphosphatidylglycerol synthase domain-containing protein [Solirubrobacteraceae bacterium]|nr:lysylphosphatidylglycerol synthase domain-containing protein [Solirubrobacteraceae bacterium]